MPHAPDLPLRTSRLVLRPARHGDAEPLAEYFGDPDVCRYLLHEPLTLEQCRDKVAAWAGRTDPQADGQALWLIVEYDGRHVGHVLLILRGEELAKAEIGWVFHPGVAGQGLATEAAAALLDVGFVHYGLRRISAQLDPRNTASVRLCERLGMSREAHLRQDWLNKGEWTDTGVYGILREEWRSGSESGRAAGTAAQRGDVVGWRVGGLGGVGQHPEVHR